MGLFSRLKVWFDALREPRYPWPALDVTLPGGVANIWSRAFDGCPNVTIHAPAGSFAEAWCLDNGIPCVND